nr:hut operon positive regulator HutP [Acetomicrobium sp.]
MLEKREGAEILDSELEEIEEEDDEMLGTIEVSFDIRQESQVGRVAVLLAATTSKTEEEYLKEQIKKLRWRAVATEVGGLAGNISGKLTRALVGAALNGNVIKKTGAEMHALMHASMEAINSFLPLC